MSKKNIVEKELDKQQVSKKHVVKRTYFFEVYLGVVIAAFGILATLAKQTPYFGFDLLITRAIQQITIPGFGALMQLITLLGNVEWGAITVVLLIIAFIAFKKNSNALFLIGSVTGTSVLSLIFKAVVSRPRPDPDLVNQIGAYLYFDSFPSGHVLFYIGCYGFLLFLAYSKLKQHLLRTVIVTALGLMLLLVGISRIYVGAHWFSDTLGAYLIGSAWLFMVIHFYSKYAHKKLTNNLLKK